MVAPSQSPSIDARASWFAIGIGSTGVAVGAGAGVAVGVVVGVAGAGVDVGSPPPHAAMAAAATAVINDTPNGPGILNLIIPLFPGHSVYLKSAVVVQGIHGSADNEIAEPVAVY